jgi:hypothetical protein
MQDFNSVLEQAIKKRILDEISRESRSAQVINNFQGGAPLASEARKPDSLQEAMFDPGAYDYLVDIEKSDVFEPGGDKPIGWRKKVRRYREPMK